MQPEIGKCYVLKNGAEVRVEAVTTHQVWITFLKKYDWWKSGSTANMRHNSFTQDMEWSAARFLYPKMIQLRGECAS